MVVNSRQAATAGASGESAGDTPRRCFCCRLAGPCECGPEACWGCGSCPTHCRCPEGFLTCECRFDGDQADARDCPVHGR